MKIKKWIIPVFRVTIIIVIIGIFARVIEVKIVNFLIEDYLRVSYMTIERDTNAIGEVLKDYFANPANKTVTTQYNPASDEGSRPYILIGKTGGDSDGYNANTLLLSSSITMRSAAQSVPTAAGISGAAAGAFQVESRYVIYACNNDIGTPIKPRTFSDSHWVGNPVTQKPCPQVGNCCYFKTL